MAGALPASVVGFAVSGALLTCAASTTSADARQQPLTRTFFASVVAKDGTPVTDLTAADVEVKEGGKLQSITSMRITTMPLRLHIIVSDGGTVRFSSACCGWRRRWLGRARWSSRSRRCSSSRRA